MQKFYVNAGQFWVDSEPQLIQAGEFHYFRTPQSEWKHRLGLLQNAGFNTLATYIPWLWHQLEEEVSDFDGHSHPMRNLEGFLDLAAAMGFYIIPRPGPYIMAETNNEGIPQWVFNKYPQVSFISQDQKNQNIVSYLHPDFLKCVAGWYKAIFRVLAPRQITRGGRIIMVQLDNEMGMIAWVRNIFDTNPHTIHKLVSYLRDAYGAQISERYPVGNLEAFLVEGLAHPSQPFAEKIVVDYRQFYRQYLREYAAWLLSEARSNGMEVPPVINIHGFANGGKTFPIGLSQLVEVMGLNGVVSATDVYPVTIGEGNFHQLLLVNEMTKALQNEDQALFSIEFQAGGNTDFSNAQSSFYDLHTRLCISSGMRAINHYLFSDGENDPLLSPVKRHDWGHPVRKDGTLRSHYHRYPRLSKVLRTYGTDLISSQSKTITTIGFILDHFMTEVNNELTRESANIITHQREVILFDMIARGLSLTHRPFNAIELSRSDLDVQKIPLLWVMMDKLCHPPVQQKLVDYLVHGGKLVLAGRVCVEDFDHKACTILMDAIGIKSIKGDLPFVSSSIHAFGYHDIPVSFLETYSGDFDHVFATSVNGECVGFSKNVGSGNVMMFGAAMAANTLDDLDIVHQMATRMGCPSLFKLSHWVDARISQGSNGSFLFLNNYQDDPVDTTVEYEHTLCFNGAYVHLPARCGLILPLDWSLNKDILVHYITSEITAVSSDGPMLVIRTTGNEYDAELSLSGYDCDNSVSIHDAAGIRRVRVHGIDGALVLRRDE